MNFLFKAVVWFCLLINVMQQCIAKHERTFSTPQFIQQSISITDDLGPKKNDPLLVIVLMVKDEQDFIQPTLQPYVDAGIKNFFIFDTKSTDSTVEVTREFFKKNNIEPPYKNFSITFFIPVGDSIRKKVAEKRYGTDHEQRPDADNCFKAFADSFNKRSTMKYIDYNDSITNRFFVKKVWCKQGEEGIMIREYDYLDF